MAGVVRADNPEDELAAYEWATELRFGGSVQVRTDAVSLSLEDTGGFWERSVNRTWDLGADLTRCHDELEDLRIRRVAVDDDAPVAEEPPGETYDDAASA